ncbi:cysteine/glutathione ABC transporter membrane /ATP-binding protein [Actinobacillus equuli]|nr:cysteine/glutathione ABC transporter membrane /ATP-binding protein [Actinobacillus equuli]
MKAIIEHIAHITQLHGSPVAKEALAAQVIREQNLNVNFQSLVEVLRSHGFENQISRRELKDIPSLSTPVLVVLQNEEAAIVTKIEGAGRERIYHLYQNGVTHTVSADSLAQIIWDIAGLLNLKPLKTSVRNCRNIICRKLGSGR